MEKQFYSNHISIFHKSGIPKGGGGKLLVICTCLRNLWNSFLVLTRDGDVEPICAPEPSPEIKAETAIRDDFASRKARAYKKASSPQQKFVHFGPVTEIDQQKWKRLSIGRAGPREDVEGVLSRGSKTETNSVSPSSVATSSLGKDQTLTAQHDHRYFPPSVSKPCLGAAAALQGSVEAPLRNLRRSHSWNGLLGWLAEEQRLQVALGRSTCVKVNGSRPFRFRCPQNHRRGMPVILAKDPFPLSCIQPCFISWKC